MIPKAWLAWLAMLIEVIWPPALPTKTIASHIEAVWTGESYVILLHDPEGPQVVLLGSGSDPKLHAVKQALRARGLSTQNISDVFLPCGHAEMVRGLQQLNQAQVHVHMADAELAFGFRPPKSARKRLALRLRGRARQPQNFREIVAGQMLTVAHWEIGVVRLEGHTPGSVGFAVGPYLFAGEALGNLQENAPGQFSMHRFDHESPSTAQHALDLLHHQLQQTPWGQKIHSIVDAHAQILAPF